MTTIKESNQLEFILHGKIQTVDTRGLKPETTLNEYIREKLHHTGTKFMCREGGCGVCVVVVKAKNPATGRMETFAVNSCLVSIMSCSGWEITTIEGLGSRADGYHDIQQKIVQFNGTQCGFCTPGMVMNMYALQQTGKTTMAEIENSFGGNICRCTGYRPILSAFKSMASDSDERILGIVPDIEDLKLCKKENCEKTCTTPCRKIETPLVYDFNEVHHISGEPEKKNWFKVTSLKEVFDIFRVQGEKSYKLVAGNTAKGVYWDMDTADYYIDIRDIPDLRLYSQATDKIRLGGNFTLTDLMDVFTKIAGNDDGFKHLLQCVEHLDIVAHVPIRNIGTVAGNLTMKHVHNEFPSDIFLLLETINAKVVIYDGARIETVTPQQYLATNMRKKLIVCIEIPPLDSSYKFGSYKIMPKSQNAHAHVNAGFLFKMNGNIVADCNIVFGSINPAFIHATESEKYIVGKELFNNNNLQVLFNTLNKELVPDYIVPDPKPEFRKQLAIALMYKFILSIAPENQIPKEYKTGGEKLRRPDVSKGVQDFKTNKSMYPIGEPVLKREAVDQASGEARYVMDLPDLPNQTFAAFVLAKAPAGSVVRSINPAEALKQDGVLAFYQASDILEIPGGMNTFVRPGAPFTLEDEIVFIPINGRVEYFFQPVGIVVATTQRAAERASDLVSVDYALAARSPLLNIRDVLKYNATDRIKHDTSIMPKKQDLNVPHKTSGQYDTTWQYHYHMETQSVNVAPDDDGGFIIHPASQWIESAQTAVSRALNIPSNKLTVSVKRVGGSYGAKISRGSWLACAATLASMKLRRPVKMWLPFHINMNMMGKRNPTSMDYEAGCDANGKLGYVTVKVYSDVGLHPNESSKEPLLDLFLNTYVDDPIQLDYSYVYTDNHTALWTRSPGSTDGVAMIESILEELAIKLGKDPVDLKLANLDTTKHPLLGKLMQEFLTWSDYRSRRAEIETFNKNNRWRKRGISMVPMTFSQVFIGNFHAHVAIYQTDGSVAIGHGGIEIGQGINTKAIQVTAYCLGIDMSMIHVKPSNNFTTPNNIATGLSMTSEAICMALQKACDILKKRIDDAAVKAKLPASATWLERVQNAYNNGAELVANEMFLNDPNDSRFYDIYGVGASEVEVDLLTGNMLVNRVDIMEDTGDSMSPIIDMGQVEGAFVMGLGFWTSEEIIMDHEGQLMTNRTWTYKPPGPKDIPVDFRVKFPDGNPNPKSPFKTKATGEPPLCMSFSVALAIRHALQSARLDANPSANPWLPISGPCTVEWTFINSLNNYKDYKL